jgi:hypothetical protein
VKSFYKTYYLDQEQKPKLLHVQAILGDVLEDIGKSPYLDALSVINSIKNSNLKLYDMLKNGKVFGIPA